MNCPVCQAKFTEEDHRCLKCGRRLPHAGGYVPAHRSALAFAMDPAPSATAVAEAPAMLELTHSHRVHAAAPRHQTVHQGSLFGLRDPQKIVNIDGSISQSRRIPRRKSEPRPRGTSSYLPYQGILEFVPSAAPAGRTLPTTVEAVVFCNRQVASLAHRAFASAIDLCIVSLLVSVFLAIVYFGCEGLAWASLGLSSKALFGASALGIWMLYEVFWIKSGSPSPGMEIARLEMVNFDGNIPSQVERNCRVIGGLVSLLPGLLGFIWALVDEESLTMQDHISKTFPTPIDLQ